MFITFEGIEGSGKTTQIDRCRRYLEGLGHRVTTTREPGATTIGRELRRLLLDPAHTHFSSRAELFCYLADRAQHVSEIVRPALEQGQWVLSDRFADSTLVYQGYGRGLDLCMLRQLNALAVDGTWPILTLVLDLPARDGLERARRRAGLDPVAASEGRFEAEELGFHERVRQGFLELARAEPGRVLVVDASGEPDEVFERVRDVLDSRLRPGT